MKENLVEIEGFEPVKPYHKSVLVHEVLQGLAIAPHKTYIDVTFGGGGHSCALLDADPTVRVIGFDWDLGAVERGMALVDQYEGRLELYWGSFSHLYKLIKKYNIEQVDGILADFGTSQFQIHNTPGLSFLSDSPLDMRISHAHFRETAADYVNYRTAHDLEQILWKYGEEPQAKAIVKAIIEERQKTKFSTTSQLVKVIERVVHRKGAIHPATRVFQALRIVVNKELENISSFMPAALHALKPGGRLACISFHSLEDRLVKDFYRETQAVLQGTVVKPAFVIATQDELVRNPSSRSAKLRVLEKL